MRKVFLENLPKSKKGIDWINSIGLEFYFHYDCKEGYIKIEDYKKESQMVTLNYNGIITNLKTSDVLKCKLKTTIGDRFTTFIYSVGDIRYMNNCTIEITECFRKYEESHKGNMKWYKYKCCQCGWDKGEIRENDIKKNNKGSCPRCGDGNSYPNKFIYNLLEQLCIDFKTEYSPEWIKPKRYDFYIPSMKIIIEADGKFHKMDNYMSGQTREESEYIDCIKDIKAKEQGLSIVRIDCNKSDMEYIKGNILKSKLNNYFDFKNIDWLECHKYSSSSRVIEACNIWNDKEEWETTKTLCERMRISDITFSKFLKQGSLIGLCDYNPEYEKIKGEIRGQKSQCKPVEIFKNGVSLGKFESASDLERQSEELFGVKLNKQRIGYVARGMTPSYKNYTFKYIKLKIS